MDTVDTQTHDISDKVEEPIHKSSRWFSFGLKSVFVVVSLFSLFLTWQTLQARKQHRAVHRVQELGGHVGYDSQLDSQDRWKTSDDELTPLWLRKAIGEHYFKNVVIVNFDEGSDPIDDDLEVIRQLPHLRQLTLFNRRKITDDGLFHLSELSHLRVLALMGTSVKGPGLRHIQSLDLEGLTLDNTSVNDETLSHLKEMSNLGWLHLNNTEITDKSISLLRDLKSLKDLEISNTRMTNEGVERLKRLLPNCKISH